MNHWWQNRNQFQHMVVACLLVNNLKDEALVSSSSHIIPLSPSILLYKIPLPSMTRSFGG